MNQKTPPAAVLLAAEPGRPCHNTHKKARRSSDLRAIVYLTTVN